MSLRKITEIIVPEFPGFSAVIYRDSEWNEWRARLVRNGTQDRDSDAFCDSKDDAIRTGRAMIRNVGAVTRIDQLRVALDGHGAHCTLDEARDAATANRMPLTICWIDDQFSFRSIVSESAVRFGVVTILPANYFVA